VRRTKVLLVCMVDSVHVARWLSNYADQEIDFFLFPSGPNRRVHHQIHELVKRSSNSIATYSLASWGRYLSVPLWAIDRILGERLRGWMLRRLIERYTPDYLHALELQHAGYIAEWALRAGRIKVPFIATNYGSDIFWFQKYPKHLKKIRMLLSRADYYSAECSRDYELASQFGFRGTLLPLIPNAGAISSTDLEKNIIPSISRKVIAVKGYQEWVGMAKVVIQALRLKKAELKTAEIVFFSCSTEMLFRIFILRLTTRLKVTGFRKHRLKHSDMLDLFARSKIYVGVSLSDGLSTSSIEAMSMGAFPIQSDTSCSSEWFEEGVSGRSVKGVAPLHVGNLIVEYFNNDDLLERARLMNAQIVSKRFNEIFEAGLFLEFYGLKKS
jgi:glycosyltransferase involved in cell wall biosynthesis